MLDAHGQAVHHFLKASVGPLDADDCFQETWLAALRAYPRLRDASNLRGWILTLAHRKAIDHVRARRRDGTTTHDVPDQATEQPADLGDEELWLTVRRLPTKQRTALTLRFVSDSSYADIAQAMQTSEPAARRNVHEALKRLRAELGEHAAA